VRPSVLRIDELSPEALDLAFRRWGGFVLDTRGTDIPWRAGLNAALSLFALPYESKRDLAIERSPNFRGWSEIHNNRDWREQLHLGRDRPAACDTPPFWRLEGPNLWPSDPAWREVVTSYMDAVASCGELILQRLAMALRASQDTFHDVAREGYLLMKMIGYHPQRDPIVHLGVAAHVDFSWLTLTLQDGPGFAIRPPGRAWTLITPQDCGLWVHAGELLEFATRGRYQAAPHRVINQSNDRTRVSIPVFVNPPLTANVPLLEVMASSEPLQKTDLSVSAEHIHRVLASATQHAVPFNFGEAEWQRKGLARWCVSCASPPVHGSKGTY
jgi:isopenicillin N synthase-like dioxygenase